MATIRDAPRRAASGPDRAGGTVHAGPRRDRDSLYRGIISGMRCGILAVDRDGRSVLVNDLARGILEIPEAPPPGSPVDEVLRDHPQLARILAESFGMASLPNRAEIALETASGKTKTIGFTLSFVSDEKGDPVGAAVFFKDLTHVEHREEQERLRDRLAALGQMSANLAHEIRNPLAGIEVSCSLLKRRLAIDEASVEILEKVIREVRRLSRTISSSLEFVRPLSLSVAPCTVETLLDEALEVAVDRRGRPGIGVERRYADGIPVVPRGPGPAPAGVREPVPQRPGGDGGGGPPPRRDEHGRRPGGVAHAVPARRSQRRPVARVRPLRGRPRRGHRPRHSRGAPGQAVLPVLHHQEARLGGGTVHGAEDRGQPPRPDRRRERSRPGSHVHRAPPSGWGRHRRSDPS